MPFPSLTRRGWWANVTVLLCASLLALPQLTAAGSSDPLPSPLYQQSLQASIDRFDQQAAGKVTKASRQRQAAGGGSRSTASPSAVTSSLEGTVVDCYNSDGVLIISLDPDDVTCENPDMRLEVDLSGPATVERDAPPYEEGGTIETEMVALDLSADSPLGPVHVSAGRAHGLQPSDGAVEGVSVDPDGGFIGGADSYFNVFVEVDIPSTGFVAHNDDPIGLISGPLDLLPAFCFTYEPAVAASPVELLDDAGTLVGWICFVTHHPIEPCPYCIYELTCAEGDPDSLAAIGLCVGDLRVGMACPDADCAPELQTVYMDVCLTWTWTGRCEITSIPPMPGDPTVCECDPAMPTMPSAPTCPGDITCDASTCAGATTCPGAVSCHGSATCSGSYTCLGGATCAAIETCQPVTCTAEATCAGSEATCSGNETCDLYPSCPGTPTCDGTTCIGSQTCRGSQTCQGVSTCPPPPTYDSADPDCGNPTMIGNPSCHGSATCAGYFTCMKATCAGIETCQAATCSAEPTCWGSGGTCSGNITCPMYPSCDGTPTCSSTHPTCIGAETCDGSETCPGAPTCDQPTFVGATCEPTLCRDVSCAGTLCPPTIASNATCPPFGQCPTSAAMASCVGGLCPTIVGAVSCDVVTCITTQGSPSCEGGTVCPTQPAWPQCPGNPVPYALPTTPAMASCGAEICPTMYRSMSCPGDPHCEPTFAPTPSCQGEPTCVAEPCPLATSPGLPTCYGSETCPATPSCAPFGQTCSGVPTCPPLASCGAATCPDVNTCAGFPTCYGYPSCEGGHTCDGNPTCMAFPSCEWSATCILGGETCQMYPTCGAWPTCNGVPTCDGTPTCNDQATCAAEATCPEFITCFGVPTCMATPTCSYLFTCDMWPTCQAPAQPIPPQIQRVFSNLLLDETPPDPCFEFDRWHGYVNPLLIQTPMTTTAPSPQIRPAEFLVVNGMNGAPKSVWPAATMSVVETVLVGSVYENTEVLEYLDTHGDGVIQQNLYVRIGFNDPPEIAGQSAWYHVTGVGSTRAPDKFAADSIYLVELEAEIPPACMCNCHADPACDGVTNVLDVVQAVSVAFRGGVNIPDPNPLCPYETTDVDCSGFTDVIDVVKLVNIAFRNGDPAREFCDPCP